MTRSRSHTTRVGLALAASIALLAGACFDTGGGAPSFNQEMAAAMPSPEDVELRVPGDANPSALTLGDTAKFYADTYRITRSVNGGVYVILSVLRDVVRLPPTRTGEDFAEWGPWTPALEPATVLLRVTRVGEGEYDYSLLMRPRASTSEADYVAVIEGSADVTGGEDVAGAGAFVLDWTAYAALNPLAELEGSMTVNYEHRTLQWRSVEVLFDDLRERSRPGTEPRDVLYRYRESADTSGDFQFAFTENVHGPLEARPEPELLQIRSRWSASGAGRSDARITGAEIEADLATFVGLEQDYVQASECWDDGFLRNYYNETPIRLTADDGELIEGTFDGAGQGDPADCAYSEPLFTDDDVTVL